MTDETIKGQMNMFDPDIWCGKMSQEHCPPTEAKTSEPSSKKPRGLSKRMPLFLDLRGNGQMPDASWETDGRSLGAYTTHSFGELPKDAAESVLSQILEEEVHPKYSLSAKACQGILNRANKRGKELPTILKEALERQAVLE